MFGAPPHELPQRISFLLVPRFTLLTFASFIDPLRMANRMSGKELYKWSLYSQDGEDVHSSCGLKMAVDGNIQTIDPRSAVVVASGLDVHHIIDNRLISWLRRIERQGAVIGGICTGAWLLAKAGLLDNHSCTIHWENIAALSEEYPELDVTSDIYEVDGKRFTCSGGTASIDLVLKLIRDQHGSELATMVADQFVVDRIRDEFDGQKISLPARLGVKHPKLLQVIQRMEANLEEPLSRSELAVEASLSTRQLERLFRKYLNRSPARYYLELRLNRARLLLLQTNMSVIDVALACGFVSASHFSKCYRDFFGKTPRRERGLLG